MNINSAEKSLASYHLLHLALGAFIAAILLAIPKLIGVLFTVFLVGMIIPGALLPQDFPDSKWLDRGAVILGAVVVGALFHFILHKF